METLIEKDAWGREIKPQKTSTQFMDEMAADLAKIPDNELNDLGKVMKKFYPANETTPSGISESNDLGKVAKKYNLEIKLEDLFKKPLL